MYKRTIKKYILIKFHFAKFFPYPVARVLLWSLMYDSWNLYTLRNATKISLEMYTTAENVYFQDYNS